MANTIVLKFGGSSLSNNENLKVVANKIINLYNKENDIVVIVSAQGKTTDKLLEEAKELSESPSPRELDMLLSTGEQVSASKLSILLTEMGYRSISLTGWQAGIFTDNTNKNAVINNINTSRIKKELDKHKIVIITGFQGINKKNDITTLGRGGSDTSAVAIAAALDAKNCYIFSDVDGIYSADPKEVPNAKKLSCLSYEEMQEISNEGAKVLHNRCVTIGKRFKVPIITKSTFNNKPGTVISDIIEENTIKSIVKKDISKISIIGNGIMKNTNVISNIFDLIEKERIDVIDFHICENKITIVFNEIISDAILKKIHNICF